MIRVKEIAVTIFLISAVLFVIDNNDLGLSTQTHTYNATYDNTVLDDGEVQQIYEWSTTSIPDYVNVTTTSYLESHYKFDGGGNSMYFDGSTTYYNSTSQLDDLRFYDKKIDGYTVEFWMTP